MSDIVNVEICWSEWKLPRIDAPGRYVAPAKFQEDMETWPNDAWSIVLDFEETNRSKRVSRGTAHFLARDAPMERLTSGAFFEMYEGLKLSATVNIL
ncbi:hypothetical protein GGE45_002736 [Rhizobium aethiopicum]|uniref:Uncharacterized protein n=1 Tax=Rhizobium aethiopicum TaxID=1138170 RepID=A0A7W6Q5C7_9HYPH|nr:hypothetical protein [Rhizobium aethiopicum]MBB4189885.1 hypothetical protein [Rhizobium aethiopicum]MBB4580406.1 hypothetical protein [Rhizobium aethiopicum]